MHFLFPFFLSSSAPRSAPASFHYQPRKSAPHASAQVSVQCYQRNPPLEKLHFQRLQWNAEDGGYESAEAIGVIEVAQNWEEFSFRSVDDQKSNISGFLGSGTAKNVIYARYGGREYALGQSKEGSEEAVNMDMLLGEYENLTDASGFADSFQRMFKDANMLFHPFYFNMKGSFMGRIQTPSRWLKYIHFIASPLLPCGPADGNVMNYTGNDNVGPALTAQDHLTRVLHAFTHFTYVASEGQVFICDLQGIFDANRVLCLFDPQSHTFESNPANRVYWDGGPEKIRSYMDHHLQVAGCDVNKYCRVLHGNWD
ncbi:kinase-like domain-containing protein [Mycena floridula]|nr:kinase-like domain-containing protein [Mycena floridula]